MARKRRRFTAEFKARVALEALREHPRLRCGHVVAHRRPRIPDDALRPGAERDRVAPEELDH